MARIRTIKPDFFRHELLQALEISHPEAHVMLSFIGLWCVADKAGRFEWKPNTLRLDILPFLSYDFENTLAILAASDLIQMYVANGKRYGLIPSFKQHQRFSGSEAKAAPRYPEPVNFEEIEPPWNFHGSSKETTTSIAESSGSHLGIPRKHVGTLERSMEYGVMEYGVAQISAGADHTPEIVKWPSTWAYDTSQAFLTNGSVVSTALCGTHAKPLKDIVPWSEWLRMIPRMVSAGEMEYGLPANLRRYADFRDAAQPDPNRELTLEEAMAL